MRSFLAALILFIPATGHANSGCWNSKDGKGFSFEPDCAAGSIASGTLPNSYSTTAPASPNPHCEPGYWLLALPHTAALVCARDLKDPLQ